MRQERLVWYIPQHDNIVSIAWWRRSLLFKAAGSYPETYARKWRCVREL